MRKLCAVLAFFIAALFPHAGVAADDPVQLVDPFIGTGGVSPDTGQIDDFPGPAAPFGMIAWSPDTPSQPASGGYFYHDHAITGFSMTHLAGAGCSIFGDFSVLPTVGTVDDPAHAQQSFTHVNESASPGAYHVTLGTALPVDVALTATPRTGLGSFTFPASTQANLLVNVSSDQAGVSDAQFQVASPQEIEGYATSGQFCGMPNVFTVYFVARFDRPFTAHGVWAGSRVTPGSDSVRGTNAGGYLTFDASHDSTVKMQVALSYVSVAGARVNLKAEATSWDLATVRAKTAAAWNALLGEIDVEGNTVAERRMFYTAIYHTMLDPNLLSDADGQYPGFDGNVHTDSPGHAEYANFSGWDTYRTTMALQALLAPKVTSDMAESLVHAAQQGGWLPKWPVANAYSSVMGGDSADPLIASAYAFGARDFDTRAALRAMIKGATDTTSPLGQGWYVERPDLSDYMRDGYVPAVHTNDVSPLPNGASETLEYAFDDFSIGQFARELGQRATAREFTQRSATWTRSFNQSTKLIAARGADGAFMQPPLTPSGQVGFQEGNAWQYTWRVPQSLGVLVQAMGGRAATVALLDQYFSSMNMGEQYPYSWFGNEPTMGSNWVYLWAGAPYRAQLVTRQVLTAAYSPTPDGLPGNDDLGTMSSFWIWCAMGMYPENAAIRRVVLGAPLFTNVTIRVPRGPRIEIDAPQAADGVPYIESLRVNGQLTQKPWIALPERGTLRLSYALARTPNVQWGTAPDDAPPNDVGNVYGFPPSTAALLDLPPTNVTLAPGERAGFGFALDNTIGTGAARASWQAVVPTGLTLTPASGTFVVAAYGKRSQRATIAAAPQLAAGFYDVALSGQTAGGALLAHAYAIVRVANQGQLTRFAYVANFSDGTVTPLDLRTGAFGSAIAVDKNPGGLVTNADGTRVYVANQGGNDVSVIDTTTQSVTATIPVGRTPATLRIAPDGTIWVTNNGDNTVMAIDAKTNTPSLPIAVGSQPEGLVVSPDGSTIYAVNQGSNSVTPIDARTRTTKTAIAVGRRPLDAAISPDGKRLYVDNAADDTVSVVDLGRGVVIATVPVGKVPQGLAISPDGSMLYVADSASLSITPIDLTRDAALPDIRVGNAPFDVTVLDGGKHLLSANSGDNECVVVDTARRTVIARIPVGNFPIALTAP